jgi:hypothetical protein
VPGAGTGAGPDLGNGAGVGNGTLSATADAVASKPQISATSIVGTLHFAAPDIAARLAAIFVSRLCLPCPRARPRRTDPLIA